MTSRTALDLFLCASLCPSVSPSLCLYASTGRCLPQTTRAYPCLRTLTILITQPLSLSLSLSLSLPLPLLLLPAHTNPPRIFTSRQRPLPVRNEPRGNASFGSDDSGTTVLNDERDTTNDTAEAKHAYAHHAVPPSSRSNTTP